MKKKNEEGTLGCLPIALDVVAPVKKTYCLLKQGPCQAFELNEGFLD